MPSGTLPDRCTTAQPIAAMGDGSLIPVAFPLGKRRFLAAQIPLGKLDLLGATWAQPRNANGREARACRPPGGGVVRYVAVVQSMSLGVTGAGGGFLSRSEDEIATGIATAAAITPATTSGLHIQQGRHPNWPRVTSWPATTRAPC